MAPRAQNRKSRRRSKKIRAAQAAQATRPGAPKTVPPEVRQGLSLSQKLIDAGQFAEAEGLLHQLQRVAPRNADILFQSGRLCELKLQTDAARGLYHECLSVAPGFRLAAVHLAALLSTQADYPQTVQVLEAALRHAPVDPQLHHLAGQAYEAMQIHGKAAEHYNVLAELRPQPAAFELLGNAQFAAGNLAEARRAFKKALQYGSKPEKILAVLARLETSVGNGEAALAHLRSALRQVPEDGFAYLQLASDFAKEIDARELLLKAQEARPVDRHGEPLPANVVPMCFAYARLHELLSEHEEAFAFYKRANESLQVHSGYDPQCESVLLDEVIGRSRCDQSVSLAGASDSLQPVFVFGLPRSGTTLLEQILTSHPEVSGLGEHEAFGWISKYLTHSRDADASKAANLYLSSYPAHAANAIRVVDKSMSTPEHIGTILKVFPNASFIHCQRHPMETGWSMYSMYFGDRRVPYSNSFEGIAARTRSTAKLMQFWRHELPDRILSVRYDDLVGDMRETTARALQHIGLDWHPACADFHQKTNMVRTASITQVRQPIYTTAKQKWRQYERHLKPLMSLLEAETTAYETAGNTATTAP